MQKTYLILLFALIACSNQTKDTSCIKTGGTITDDSCICPTNKYYSSNSCQEITQKETSACEKISNNYVNCKINNNNCECTYKDSGTITFLPLSKIMNSNTECSCNNNVCECINSQSLLGKVIGGE